MERRKSLGESTIKLVLAALLISFVGFEAYRFVHGVAEHGSVTAYVEAREKEQRLEAAVDLINRFYVDEPGLEAGAVRERALESILSGLDPYSAYLGPEEYRQLEEEARQEFGGIGIRVEMKDGRLAIAAPMPGSPGERAGLLRGDHILAVDGVSLEGQPMRQTLSRLRGPPGTEALLSLYRPSSDEHFDAMVVREIIAVENARDARMVDSDIGYLRLAKFGSRTAEEMAKALASLETRGMAGLILDLRNNPGGLLEEAVEVASSFLEEGQLVVYTEGRQRRRQEWKARKQPMKFELPLVVLINPASASASEIVAGALKDWGRAALVGERTFGKGSVQSVIGLGSDAAISLTTANYYTPGGYVIHGQGVEPDFEVALDREQERKLAIQRSQLEFLNLDDFVEEFGFEPIPDPQLDRARDLLKQRL